MWCPCGTIQNLGILLFRALVLRHGMPYLWLKDCHVAALLAMTGRGASRGPKTKPTRNAQYRESSCDFIRGSIGKPPGGCSCPEKKYAAGRKKSAVRRKNTQPGMRKKPTDISDFCEFFFYIVCVILFKISPSESTRKSKFVCIFCGLTSKKKENILKSANRYIAYRTNEQEAEHHGSEYKFCGRPV